MRARISLICLACGCVDTSLVVKNDPPEVVILEPVDGAQLAASAPLQLTARVSDLETASEDLELYWVASPGGALSGATTLQGDLVAFTVEGGLSAGSHVIELTAVDSHGDSASDSVTLELLADAPPSVSFLAPQEGARLPPLSSVEVKVQVADDLDSPDALTLSWEGVEGAEPPAAADASGLARFVLPDLEPGDLELVVTAQDSGGNSQSARLSLEVHGDLDGDGYDGAAWGGDDCDDQDEQVNPGALEVCDGVDNDCDGEVDEADAEGATTWYSDVDGDGHGDPEAAVAACEQPSGSSALDDDCDDGDASVFPGAGEICDDGVDNDCDGDIDDCPSGTLLASGADAMILGVAASDRLGCALRPALDPDGDGDDDLLVGAREAGRAGEAYLMLGPVTGTVSSASAAVTFAPSSGGSKAGAAVGAGDFNGDGVPDYVIADPWDSTVAYSAGVTYLVLGPVTGSVDLLNADAIFYGQDDTSYSGRELAPPRDLDGDGYDDLLIGVWGDDGAAPQAGAVYLFHGPIRGSLSYSAADGVVQGEVTSRYLDASNADGDVDGDGLLDVVLGATGTGATSTQDGRAFLFLGGFSGTVSAASADATVTGQGVEALGTHVCIAPDVDGDGYDDVLVGAQQSSTLAPRGGAAYLFYGLRSGGTVSSASADTSVYGPGTNHYLEDVGVVGDLNGDGASEITLGAWGDDSAASYGGGRFIFYSPPATGALATTDADVRIYGDAALTGLSLGGMTGPMDFNGDGDPDLLVPAETDDQAGTDAGAVFIWTL